MVEQYNEQSIQVFALAEEEARRLGHNFVDTEHILLGLLGQGKSNAAKALVEMGCDLKSARVEVEAISPRGPAFVPGELPLRPDAKNALELARAVSEEFNYQDIGPEHILLGLVRQQRGCAMDVMRKLAVDTSKLPLYTAQH